MLKAGLNRVFIFCLSVAFLGSSCWSVSELGRKQFSFQKDNRLRKLIFQLPKGKSEEQLRVGDGDAREQFYYFGDGSVFYVARHTTWPTINHPRIMQLTTTQQKASSLSGKDDKGLYWKETRFEEFRIGYGYVEPSRLEKFNEGLNSVKIR